MKIKNWFEIVSITPELKYGVEILNILKEYGNAYIVGGSVRDLILERNINDVDISTNVRIEIIEELFPTHDIGSNKSFGIVIVQYKGHNFEIAQFRIEDVYSDGRRPDDVQFVSTFKEDSKRRDFTFNSLAVDGNGNILDYHNGINDLKNKVIRTVGDPHKRFKEDFLRMIRCVRFSSVLGMTVHEETYNAIIDNVHKIVNISQERITAEIFKMAKYKGNIFSYAIRTLFDIGLLKYVMPEIYKMDSFEHTKNHHPEGLTVLDHILSALEENVYTDPTLNLCILFHDVGKIETYELIDGKKSYHGHDLKGSDMIEDIAQHMKIDNKTKDCMKFCVKNHMKVHLILEMKKSKIVKLISSPYWSTLLRVAYVDDKCRLHLYDQDRWDSVLAKVEHINEQYANKETDALTCIRKVVTGKMVMKIKGITKPCKEIGDIIKTTIEWISNEDIDLENIEEIESYIKML